MRSDEDIRHVPQHVVLGQWFRIRYIQSDTAEPVLLCEFNQIVRDNGSTSSAVDEDAAFFHLPHALLIKQSIGLSGSGQREGDDVALRQDLIHGIRGVECLYKVRLVVNGSAYAVDSGTQCMHLSSEGRADIAHADAQYG